MNLLHAMVLGLIQGLTEFLPVSSTAHLTLAENVLLHRSMPLAFDVLLHAGTLLALIIYFRHDLAHVLVGIGGRDPKGRTLALWLLVAMVPTGIFGMATRSMKESAKDHIWIYGAFLLVTAAMLYAADAVSRRREGRELGEMNAVDALAVGTVQGLGGGFGLSRSGSTISMGAFRGLRLHAATRFSFLLAIPTIAAATLVEGWHLLKPLLHHQPLPADLAFPEGSSNPALLSAVGVAVAAVSGYCAIGLLDRLTQRPRLVGFAIYCVFAGALLLLLGL